MSDSRYSRAFDGLTRRERRVYALIVRKGCEPGEIAELLGISANTVRQHLRQLLVVFGAATPSRLIVSYWTRELKRAKSQS